MRYPEDGEKGEQRKMCLAEDEEDEEEYAMANRHPTPPDGGWGWFVVLAAFLCNLVVDGVCFSFGVVMEEFRKAFDASHTAVGWIGSSLVACYLLVGPFVSAMCARYGCRKVTIIGSIITMLGFVLSTQSNSLEMLIITYGIIGGIGFGMIYLPSIVCVGHWFEKKRAFATGIAVCGSGVGQFVFPPLARYLLTEYTWQGKNLIFAGIALNCAVFGMLFFPLDRRNCRRRKPMRARVEIERGAIMKALIEDKKRQRTISNGSLDNCIITRDNRLIKVDPKIFECKRSNSFIARFKRQLGFSSQSLACSKNSLQGIPSIVIDAVQKDLNKTSSSPIYRPNGTKVQNLPVQKRSSLPDGHVLVNGVSSTPNGMAPLTNGLVVTNGIAKTHSCDAIPKESDLWQKMPAEEGLTIHLAQISGPPAVTRSASDLQQPTPLPQAFLDGSVISIQEIPNGACSTVGSMRYRSGHSVTSGYTNPVSSQATYVTNSVLSIPQYQASVEEMELELKRQESLLWKFWWIFCEMVSIGVLRDPVFALLAVSAFITLAAYFIPYFYIPLLGSMLGMDRDSATYLLSIMGITNTLGRILCGWLADRPWICALHFNIVSLLLGGFTTLVLPFCESQTMLAVLAAIIGLCCAIFISLRSILLVDLLGLDKLTKSFGMLILFQGVASLVGTPLMADLIDNSSVNDCFYLGGGLTILSALLLVPIICLRKRTTSETEKLPPPMPSGKAITETLRIENIESPDITTN